MNPQALQQLMAQMGGQGGAMPQDGYQQPGMPPVPMPAPAPPPTMPPGGPGPVQPPLAQGGGDPAQAMMGGGQNPMALMKLLMMLEAMNKMKGKQRA